VYPVSGAPCYANFAWEVLFFSVVLVEIYNKSINTTIKQMPMDDFVFIMLMAQHLQQTENVSATTKKRRFLNLINEVARRNRDRKIPRCSLVHPASSSWARLYESRVDSSLITCTGLNYECFDGLLIKFSPLYNSFTPYTSSDQYELVGTGMGGRPRSLDASACLGLVLSWNRIKSKSDHLLCMIFGITSSPLSLFLRFGRRIFIPVQNTDTCGTFGQC